MRTSGTERLVEAFANCARYGYRSTDSGEMQPGQLLVAEQMLGGFEPAGVVEGADVEMRLGRQFRALAGQRRAAGRAETARRGGRRFEPGDLALGHPVGVALEADEHRDRRPAVP